MTLYDIFYTDGTMDQAIVLPELESSTEWYLEQAEGATAKCLNHGAVYTCQHGMWVQP